MKNKLQYKIIVLPMPNQDGKFIIQEQFTENGPIFTDDNFGGGYTAEEAGKKSQWLVSRKQGCTPTL